MVHWGAAPSFSPTAKTRPVAAFFPIWDFLVVVETRVRYHFVWKNIPSQLSWLFFVKKKQLPVRMRRNDFYFLVVIESQTRYHRRGNWISDRLVILLTRFEMFEFVICVKRVSSMSVKNLVKKIEFNKIWKHNYDNIFLKKKIRI